MGPPDRNAHGGAGHPAAAAAQLKAGRQSSRLAARGKPKPRSSVIETAIEAQAPAPSFLHLGFGQPVHVEEIGGAYRCTFRHQGCEVHLLRSWCEADGRPACWRWSPVEQEDGA
jgi:hypothetical protein